jgi:regulator of protease activity HflC (stomatin/prohibitin superfamily)
MLTFLAVTAALFALAMYIVHPMLRKEDGLPDRYGDYKKKAPDFLLMWDSSNRIKLLIFSALLVVLGQSMFFAREGNQYYVLSKLTGHRSAVMSPGLKFTIPFSIVQEWSKYIDVKGVRTNPETGEYTESVEGIEGVIPGGVKVMFIDRATADVFLSVRFELPADEDSFIKLVETYKTPDNLIKNTLLPTITEQLTNVSFMYSADEYVSGGASDYKLTIEDALKNGGFVVKRVEIADTLYTPEIITVDSLVSKPRQIQEIRKLTKNTKVIENGLPKRNPHEINTNKVITASVIVSDVSLEKSFTDKLKQQRDISAEKIIEIQKIETAAAAQQRIIAEGERDKAAERVAQEKAQVSKLINIETQVKEEESKRQLAEIAVQTAELEAKATLTRERAQAEANRLKVSAGLTPQERAEWEYKTAVGVATQLKELSLPQTYIQGASGDKGGSILEQLIGAELAKSMLKK